MNAGSLQLYELVDSRLSSITVLAYNEEEALELISTHYFENKHYPYWTSDHPISTQLGNVIDRSLAQRDYDSMKNFQDTHVMFEFRLSGPMIIDSHRRINDIDLFPLLSKIAEQKPLKNESYHAAKSTWRKTADRINLYLLYNKVLPGTLILAYTPEQAIEILYRQYLYNLSNRLPQDSLLADLFQHNIPYGDKNLILMEFELKESVLYESYHDKKPVFSPSNSVRLSRIPLSRLQGRWGAPPMRKNMFDKRIQQMKYAPGGNVNQAHKLWLQKCTDAKMKFSKEELFEAARKVGANVTFKMTKDEICKAINDIYFAPELVQPEVQGPQPLGGGWVGSRDEVPETLAQIKYRLGGKEAVKKSHLKYSHVDLTSQIGKKSGYAFDIEYGIDGNELLVEWRSEVPFKTGDEQWFNECLSMYVSDSSLGLWTILSYNPAYTRWDQGGTINMKFRILDRERFNRLFDVKNLAILFLNCRKWIPAPKA
jgi:hypothetical protein